ncbi:MAG: PTPA-CTERM sorting domain-containing protein, partial [Cyanobacteria bacterium J06636_28]
ILGKDYKVFFNTDDADNTITFNDVYGDFPSLTFTSKTDAEAAVAAILAVVPGDEFADGPLDDGFGDEWFLVPWTVSSGVTSFTAARGDSAGNLSSRSASVNTNFQDQVVSFATFEEVTPVPTPAAVLPGLIGMGFSAIRKRNLAEADEA